MSPIDKNRLSPERFAPGPSAWGKKLGAGALVVLLHLVLGVLIVLGLREQSLPIPAQKPVELALLKEHKSPPLPLPIPKLVAPKPSDLAPPQIDIAPAPQSALSGTPQGVMPSSAGGGGDGNGGQGIRTAAAPKPPPDPNCETIDAYKERVHRAIERYARYPDAAQEKNIQGVITLHFVSNPAGKVLVHAVAGSRTMRTYRIAANNGRQIPFTFTFTRVAANQWNYEVVTQTSDKTPDMVPLAAGTLQADAAGALEPDRLVFDIPSTVAATRDGKMTVPLGSRQDLFLLEDRVNQAIEDTQPLPAIPACLKLATLNALMPFGFELKVPGVLFPPQN